MAILKKNNRMAAIGVLLTLALIIEYTLAKPIYTVMEVL